MTYRKRVWAIASLLVASSLVAHANALFSEDFESPTNITGYVKGSLPDTAQWVGATEGYGAGERGMIDKDGGDFIAPDPNHQGFAFRYTNSGVTSGEEAVSVLYTGITHTISFDVGLDGYNDGRAYTAQFIAFAYGAARNDCREIPAGSRLLKQVSGNAPTNGQLETVTFTYTAGSNDLAYLGYDLGIRFRGQTTSANIDNVIITDDATGDEIPPLVQWTYPLKGQTTVAPDAKLVMIFHEDILKGSGSITIKRQDNDATVETISVDAVSITNRTAYVTPSAPLASETGYYVVMDAGVFEDAAGNPSLAITSPTAWRFSTSLADLSGTLWYDSFESPVVTGSAVKTAPENWLRSTTDSNSGLANEAAGTFVTPYGAQAAAVWNVNSGLTLDEGMIVPEVLVAEQELRLAFNVAKPSNRSGAYVVSLMAFTNGAVRTDTSVASDGVVLESVSGTAIMEEMGQQRVSFSYTAATTNAYLGQLLSVRIGGAGAMVDNLTLSYIAPPPSGSVLIVK